MNNKQLLENLIAQLDRSSIFEMNILPVDKYPVEIAEDIKRFRAEYGNLNLSDIKFYTYSFPNMILGIAALNYIKVQWEKAYSSWLATHEITFSVYPAMDENYVLNFYFMPTWIKKDSFTAGGSMKGNIVDFVKHVYDEPNYPNSSYGPFYTNDKGYIYDLGSSCP